MSAPAGFGKTTLLAQWLPAAAADGRFVAWLSLDHRDNDPASFWTYVAGALRTAAEGVGANALSLLQRPEPPNEAGLAHLLNDLDSISNDVVLVLDDYHIIDARDVQDGMGFLLEHLPPQIHLVIASRAGPLAHRRRNHNAVRRHRAVLLLGRASRTPGGCLGVVAWRLAGRQRLQALPHHNRNDHSRHRARLPRRHRLTPEHGRAHQGPGRCPRRVPVILMRVIMQILRD